VCVFDYEAKLINLPERKKCNLESMQKVCIPAGAPRQILGRSEKIPKP